jgi:hypothetical protein
MLEGDDVIGNVRVTTDTVGEAVAEARGSDVGHETVCVYCQLVCPYLEWIHIKILTHCGPVTQICVFCVFALQL